MRCEVKIDLDQIRNLLSVVSQTDITELTIESGDERITVKKGPVPNNNNNNNSPAHLEMVAAPQPAARQAVAVQEQPAKTESNNRGSEKVESDAGLVAITSPMVGTFYRAPSPTAPSFVEVGDHVSVGQTVCIIEAMKLMNDLPSEVAGKIVKVLAENGTTVEFGQTLFLVDPRG
jgi:acetyl-CoA carboxylase biotin carboxyl carrier protein